MKTPILITALSAILVITAVFCAAPFQQPPQPLAGFFPSGAALYLEAQDFSAELRDWNASTEQSRWLASTRYEGFTRSNLFLKLGAAAQEFGSAAGFAPDSALLSSLSGGQSAVAIYDIGNLEFLYVTRMPGARIVQTALWQSRARYETRRAGGTDFFVRVEAGRTVAFASTADYLILGTREELVAGALRLLAGESLSSVKQESWYTDSVAAAGAPGEFRLVLNPESLVKSPQFRSYWLQRNVSEIRAYRAGIADLVRTHSEIREERVFLRTAPAQAVRGDAEGLARLVPDNAAFSRASSAPTADQVLALVEQKIFAPKVTPRFSYDYAPPVDQAAEPGQESDLETRIDEPPLAAQSSLALDDLRRLLSGTPLDAVLQVQTGETLADGVFVVTPTVLVVEGSRPWDVAATRNALSAAAASVWTVAAGAPGTGWTAHPRGSRTWYALDGLEPLEFAIDGNLLWIANSEQALGRVLDRAGARAAASDIATVALFRHSAARDNYHRMMSMLDYGQPAGNQPFAGFNVPPPAFFSQDLWSLSGVLASIREVEVRTRDAGPSVRETVAYR